MTRSKRIASFVVIGVAAVLLLSRVRKSSDQLAPPQARPSVSPEEILEAVTRRKQLREAALQAARVEWEPMPERGQSPIRLVGEYKITLLITGQGIGLRPHFQITALCTMPEPVPESSMSLQRELFQAVTEHGPYYRVFHIASTPIDTAALAAGAPLKTYVSDDLWRVRGTNAVFYRISISDADGRRIHDFPPAKVPVIPPPNIEDGHLIWEPAADDSPPPDVRFTFALDLIGVERSTVLEARPGVPMKLPESVLSLRHRFTLTCNVPLELSGNGDAATPAEWTYGPITVPVLAKEVYPPGAGPPVGVIADGGRHAPLFRFSPGKSDFGAIQFFWRTPEGDTTARGIDFAEEPRTFVLSFIPPGADTSEELVILLPGIPRNEVRVISGDGEATIVWPGWPSPEQQALFAAVPHMIIQRDGVNIASVPTSTGRYVDTPLTNGQNYNYKFGFEIKLRTEGWVAGLGRIPAVLSISPVRTQSKVTLTAHPNPMAGYANIGLGMSELCYTGTGKAHILARHLVVKTILAAEGARLLDRFSIRDMLRELALEAAEVEKKHGQTAILIDYLLRFSDVSRLDRNGLGLHFTELDTGKTSAVWEVVLPHRDATESVDTVVAALHAKLAAILPAASPLPRKRSAVTRVAVGSIHPVEETNLVGDTDALTDEWTVVLADKVPGITVLSRAEMAEILSERVLAAEQNGKPPELSAGEVFLAGRVWHADDETLAYAFMATDVRSGEILGSWYCEREGPGTPDSLASWVRDLTIPEAAVLPGGSQASAAQQIEARLAPINPDFWLPKVRREKHARYVRGQGEHHVERTLNDARQQWQDGHRAQAMGKIEDVWLKRALITDPVECAVLPRLAVQLADWYQQVEEYTAEVQVREWYLQQVQANTRPGGADRSAYTLPAEQAQHLLMRAKLRANNADRAAELARAKARRESMTDAAGAKPEARPPSEGTIERYITFPRRATGKVVSRSRVFHNGQWRPVPAVTLGLPLPRELDQWRRQDRFYQRSEEDPLFPVRPVVCRDFGLSFERYVRRFAEYLQDDARAFQQAAQLLAKMQRPQAADEPAGPRLVELVQRNGNSRVARLVSGSVSVPDYHSHLQPLLHSLFANDPYLCIQILRHIPRELVTPFLEQIIQKEIGRLEGAGRRFPEYPYRQVPAWEAYLAGTLLAEWDSAEARRFCSDARERARRAVAILEQETPDAVKKMLHGNSVDNQGCASALLILAASGDEGAAQRCDRQDYAENILGWQGGKADVLRFLLDQGCEQAFAVAVAGRRSHSSFAYVAWHNFIWRSVEEIDRLTEVHAHHFDEELLVSLLRGIEADDQTVALRVAACRAGKKG